MTQPSAGGAHPAAAAKVHKSRKRPTPKPAVEVPTVTKARVEILANGEPVKVAEKPGPVTFMDKVKKYYHTVITVGAAILVLLNQIVAAVSWIPDYGPKAAGYVSVAIVIVTAIVNALKSNEQWVNNL